MVGRLNTTTQRLMYNEVVISTRSNILACAARHCLVICMPAAYE
jgi:hypothetical protein